MTPPYESYARSPSALTPKQQVSQLFAKRSGGPTTKRGREVASRNAFKHGAYQRVFKQGEAFDHLKRTLMTDLAPDGPLQQWHAERIVEEMWRLTLLGQNTLWLEQHAFDLQNKAAQIITSYETEFDLRVPVYAQAFFMDYEEADRLAQEAEPLYWAHARFVLLRRKGIEGRNFQQAYPELYAHLYSRYRLAALEFAPEMPEEDINSAFDDCARTAFQDNYFSDFQAELFEWEDARGKMWVAQHAPEISAHIQAFVASQFMATVTSPTRIRAEAHLTRTLQVRMKELQSLKTMAANAETSAAALS